MNKIIKYHKNYVINIIKLILLLKWGRFAWKPSFSQCRADSEVKRRDNRFVILISRIVESTENTESADIVGQKMSERGLNGISKRLTPVKTLFKRI